MRYYHLDMLLPPDRWYLDVGGGYVWPACMVATSGGSPEEAEAPRETPWIRRNSSWGEVTDLLSVLVDATDAGQLSGVTPERLVHPSGER